MPRKIELARVPLHCLYKFLNLAIFQNSEMLEEIKDVFEKCILVNILPNIYFQKLHKPYSIKPYTKQRCFSLLLCLYSMYLCWNCLMFICIFLFYSFWNFRYIKRYWLFFLTHDYRLWFGLDLIPVPRIQQWNSNRTWTLCNSEAVIGLGCYTWMSDHFYHR